MSICSSHIKYLSILFGYNQIIFLICITNAYCILFPYRFYKKTGSFCPSKSRLSYTSGQKLFILMSCPFSLQFLYGEIPQIGLMFFISLINKTHMADKRLDSGYFQQWRYHQKL